MSQDKAEYKYTEVPGNDREKENEQIIPETYGFGVRHVQVFIMFVCLSTGVFARGHIGVTIVAMAQLPKSNNITEAYNLNTTNVTNYNEYFNTTVIESDNNTDFSGNIPEIDEKSLWDVYRTYEWPKSVQDLILGAFFLGYLIMMFPMGMVCQRFGGKLPLQIGLLTNAVILLLTPYLAVWGGWKAVCATRILQGLTQAGFYPSMHILAAKWVPLSERARMTSYVYAGANFGIVIAFPISGLLSASKFGWPSVFWFGGALCLVSFILLTIFGAASPLDHKTIKDEEKNFILGRIDDGKKKNLKTPWKDILCSRYVWPVFATHVGCGFVYVFFFTQIPSYIHYILNVDIKNNGMLSSLPYICALFTSLAFGVISDYCTNNNIFSLITARRIFNNIATVVPALCFIAASYTSSLPLVLCCFVCGFGCLAAMHVSWMVNYIDMAPNFSASLMATGNTLMNLSAMILPVLTSKIITDPTDVFQWRTVCFVVAGVVVLTNLVFVIFLTTDTQPWNDVKKPETDNSKYA